MIEFEWFEASTIARYDCFDHFEDALAHAKRVAAGGTKCTIRKKWCRLTATEFFSRIIVPNELSETLDTKIVEPGEDISHEWGDVHMDTYMGAAPKTPPTKEAT